MVKKWNEVQKKYKFTFFSTSPRRRHIDFELGRYDISLYDNPSWGWGGRNIEYSCIYEFGSEVFFSKKQEGKTFYKDLKNKKIAAMRGYHYAFAQNINNEDELKKKFNITLLNSPSAVIGHVLRGWSEIGLASEAFIDDWNVKNKSNGNAVYKSEIKDQKYSFRVIVRRNSIVDIGYLYENLGLKCIEK